MQIRNSTSVLARVVALLLPGVMLLANSAYWDWRFYQRFSALRDRNFEYTAPIVGGASGDASFPMSVIVAWIAAVTWMFLSSYVLIEWRKASRENKLG